MSPPESITRKHWIDQAPAHEGWSPILAFDPHAPRERIALTERPTASGPADYVLYDHGQPLVVVEAKRPSTAPQNVLAQAQRYARGLHASPDPTSVITRFVRGIVARIEALFAQADAVEAAVARGLRRVEQYEQSALARAFRGELVRR